jgi:hypothetical protein
MPASLLTYATAFPYLVGLGQRFSLIGRAELTLTGEASGELGYPLLLIEADPSGNEIIDPTRPTGLDTFTIAVQVLTQAPNPTQADLVLMLEQTNGWVDNLTEQLRKERGGQLAGVNKLSLPGQAGTDLACGWRVELQLKLAKDINRNTNAGLFTPETILNGR